MVEGETARVEFIGHQTSGYFPGLDALRGVAAFVVVFYHVLLPIGIILVPAGYLAVDFFFMLSGFVIANAYQDRLREGLPVRRFATIRIVRLYPLLVLGMAMGVAVSAVKVTFVLGWVDLWRFMLSAAMAFLMIPFGHLSYSNSTSIYPFDGPAWSLFFEIAINLVYAAVLVKLRIVWMSLLAAAAGIWLLYSCLINGGADLGGTIATFIGGVPRVCFSFLTGALIFQHVASRRASRRPTILLLCMAALLLALTYPNRGNPEWSDPLVIFFAFPTILIVAALNDNVARLARPAKFLGALSYPLYITHYPVMRVFQFLCEKYRPTGATLVFTLMTEFIAILAVSYFALRLFDLPIQRRLRRYLELGSSPRASAFPASESAV